MAHLLPRGPAATGDLAAPRSPLLSQSFGFASHRLSCPLPVADWQSFGRNTDRVSTRCWAPCRVKEPTCSLGSSQTRKGTATRASSVTCDRGLSKPLRIPSGEIHLSQPGEQGRLPGVGDACLSKGGSEASLQQSQHGGNWRKCGHDKGTGK